VPERLTPTLAPREHTDWKWLPYREAADACFSPSNAEAILLLPEFVR
jgi:dATP pyrophosphohydrolase